MNESEARTRIAEYEGNKSHMYKDTKGLATVGIGFNLERTGAKDVVEGVGADYDRVLSGEDGLTDDQVQQLFAHDLANAESEASGIVKNFGSLNDPRQFVVVDLIFNLGSHGFGAFHHAIAAIEAEEFDKAADELKDSAWYGQVGSRAEKDCQMMRTGEWA